MRPLSPVGTRLTPGLVEAIHVPSTWRGLCPSRRRIDWPRAPFPTPDYVQWLNAMPGRMGISMIVTLAPPTTGPSGTGQFLVGRRQARSSRPVKTSTHTLTSTGGTVTPAHPPGTLHAHGPRSRDQARRAPSPLGTAQQLAPPGCRRADRCRGGGSDTRRFTPGHLKKYRGQLASSRDQRRLGTADDRLRSGFH